MASDMQSTHVCQFWTGTKRHNNMSHLNFNTVLAVIVSFRPPAGGGQLTCGHGVDPELRKLLLLLAHMRGHRHRKGAELPEQPADLSGLHVAAEPDERRTAFGAARQPLRPFPVEGQFKVTSSSALRQPRWWILSASACRRTYRLLWVWFKVFAAATGASFGAERSLHSPADGEFLRTAAWSHAPQHLLIKIKALLPAGNFLRPNGNGNHANEENILI